MTKKYKIDYKNNSANYLSIDQELIIPYYDKIVDQLKKKGNLVNIITLDEYKSNIKKFNQYQKDISVYILDKGPEESKEYIKSLMGLNNIEADNLLMNILVLLKIMILLVKKQNKLGVNLVKHVLHYHYYWIWEVWFLG